MHFTVEPTEVGDKGNSVSANLGDNTTNASSEETVPSEGRRESFDRGSWPRHKHMHSQTNVHSTLTHTPITHPHIYTHPTHTSIRFIAAGWDKVVSPLCELLLSDSKKSP